MAKYRVVTKSFINNSLHEADAVVEYEGVPGANLEPIDTAAQLASTAAKGANAESRARFNVAATGGDPNDPEQLKAAAAAAEDAARLASEAATLAAARAASEARERARLLAEASAKADADALAAIERSKDNAGVDAGMGLV